MAVILLEGFDLYNSILANTGLQSRWTPVATLTGFASLEAGRFGGQALRFLGNSTSNLFLVAPLSSAISAGTLSFAINVINLPTTEASVSYFAFLRSGAGAGDIQLGLRVDPLGSIDVLRGSTTITTGTVLGSTPNGTLMTGVYSFIELEFVISNTVGSIRLIVDGVERINLTNIDTQNTTATVDNLCIGASSSTTNNLRYDIDDIYMTDGASLGEMRIETLRPTSDTATKSFVPLTGLDNFAMVDDTVCDGDTTYIQSSVVGDFDLYDLSNLSSSPTSVPAIQLTMFALKTDAATRTIEMVAKSGAVESSGSAVGLASSYRHYQRILNTNPDGNITWNTSSINALQIGPRVAS